MNTSELNPIERTVDRIFTIPIIRFRKHMHIIQRNTSLTGYRLYSISFK